MDDLEEISMRVLALLFVLVVIVYFTGATQVLGSLGSGMTKLIYAVTGRNAQGAFAGYPTGSQTQAAA